jgi:hypothetical protein
MIKGRGNILVILVDDAVVMWVLHARHDGTSQSLVANTE